MLNNLNFTEWQQLLRLVVDDVIYYEDNPVTHTVIPLPPLASAEKVQLPAPPLAKGFRDWVKGP